MMGIVGSVDPVHHCALEERQRVRQLGTSPQQSEELGGQEGREKSRQTDQSGGEGVPACHS